MQQSERKAAVAAYKERKVSAGIYAVRCLASGDRWVGRAPDLDTIQNRLWFTLKFGANPHAGLQRAWNIHGPDHFEFEVLERLTEEALTFVRDAVLKQRLAHWRAVLGAEVL